LTIPATFIPKKEAPKRMIWQTINNVGSITFSDTLQDGLGIRMARWFLNDLARAFAKECVSYHEIVYEGLILRSQEHCKDCPHDCPLLSGLGIRNEITTVLQRRGCRYSSALSPRDQPRSQLDLPLVSSEETPNYH
jgi:hypothetical protein